MATLKEIFEGNTADILEATELLKVLGDREGQFVWKQLTAEGGDFVAFVTADDENSYPNGGTQDGYWYESVKEGIPYTGANPLTIGEAGATIPANTLLEEALQILNGVQGGLKGEVVTFTPSGNVTTVTLNHSLGKAVSRIIITANSIPTKGSYYVGAFMYPVPENSTMSASFISQHDKYNTNALVTGLNCISSNTATSIKVSLPTTVSYKFQSGKTYTAILLA